ncbi:MAG: alpha/beta hydrolase [Vicinamibacterales bacterium]
MLREIPGPDGPLEALLEEPSAERGVDRDGRVILGVQTPRAAVVFAHPHPQFGGTMHTKVVYHATKALGRIGCAVLRFNFRGVGASAGTHDNGDGERDDFTAGLDFMRARYPDVPLWAAGMSFGSWIALNVGAADARVNALLGIAMPASRDFSAVARSTKPKFFIHGERDETCPLAEVRAFYASAAEPKELVVIDAADHLFDGKVGEVADAIEDLLADWGTT